MAYWLNKEFGVEVGTMTAIHAFTSSQMILDGPKGKKFRPNRTASANTIPHSTGAAKAIGLVIPELDGHLQGHAQRVAVVDGSVCELVSVLKTKVTADQVNDASSLTLITTQHLVGTTTKSFLQTLSATPTGQFTIQL